MDCSSSSVRGGGICFGSNPPNLGQTRIREGTVGRADIPVERAQRPRSSAPMAVLCRRSGHYGGMSEQPIVLWLRRDLRLSDLPPLLAAQGRQVLACFVLDPALEASS